jgi:hypothetical protein
MFFIVCPAPPDNFQKRKAVPLHAMVALGGEEI